MKIEENSDQPNEIGRDEMLLRLLKTPPQQRPKRERGKQKPTRPRASRATSKKPSPSA